MTRWPLHKAYFWQEAPLFRPLLALIAGIFCYDHGLPPTRFWLPVIIILVCSGLLLITAALIRSHGPTARVYLPLMLVFFASLGWCAYASGDSRNRRDWFAKNVEPDGASIVRLLEEPQQRAASTRATVEVLYSMKAYRICRVSGRALLYLYRRKSGPSYTKGDTLLVPARWQPVRNSGNPFSFDNVRFQSRKGIFFQQFLSPDQVSLIGKSNPRNAGLLDRTHTWCKQQLNTYLPDSAAAGLLQAMLLGDERGFDPELREAYSQTGVIHIVSISGAHVAVLFLVVTGLLFWIKGTHGRWIKYAVGVSLVWLYVLMAGAPPSALRSAVMFTVIALSVISGREGQALNTVIAAAAILLLGSPQWLFSVGFQLSFGAVLSILIFYKPIYGLLPQTTWLGRIAWQAVSASIAAEILTAPLVVYYFHNFPLLFIIANLLSVALVGLGALIGGIAIVALSWIPPLAGQIGKIVILFVTVFNAFILKLQHYNPESFQYLQISVVELLLIYLLIAALGVWWLQRHFKAALLALPTACILFLLLGIDVYQSSRQDKLIVYSNGRQALAERIRGPYFHQLAGKSAGNYNATTAHTGWHAWKEVIMRRESPVLYVGGRTAFLLHDSTVQAYTNPFPVDVLIICRSLSRLQPANILDRFSPQEVVLAQRPSAYHLRRWKDSCARHNAHLYNVAEDGAYIME